ncbi:MAG: hypothetical protein AB7I98_11150 [Verrucomicrobiales bacterium]|nr:hypothetical protein [Akkermansiaceae bacterium]
MSPNPCPESAPHQTRVAQAWRWFAGLLTVFLTPHQAWADTGMKPLEMVQKVAEPYVVQGFDLRRQPFSGVFESSAPVLLRQQLYRGNEYWFWASSTLPPGELKVEIFNDEGTSVAVESLNRGDTAGVRVLPKKTGTYTIRLIATEGSSPTGATWAMVYGYR